MSTEYDAAIEIRDGLALLQDGLVGSIEDASREVAKLTAEVAVLRSTLVTCFGVLTAATMLAPQSMPGQHWEDRTEEVPELSNDYTQLLLERVAGRVG